MATAVVHRGDETAWVNTDVRRRRVASVVKTPIAETIDGTRQKLSMIATVTNQERTCWMFIDDAVDADKLDESLAALVKDAAKIVS